MSDEELKAIRELDKRISDVGAQRGGVLYDVQRLVSTIHHSLDAHTQADERASHALVRELDAMRKAIEGLNTHVAGQTSIVATLLERSAHHDKRLQKMELALGSIIAAGGTVFGAGKLAGWF